MRQKFSLVMSAFALLCSIGSVSAQEKSLNVITSIKPLHSLTASLMQGGSEPSLLIDQAASPHTMNLKPSQAEMLSEADLVIWVGPSLEAFLQKPVATLAGKASVLTGMEVEGLKLLPLRGDHDHHHHGHSHEHNANHDHHHEENKSHDHAHEKAHDHSHENQEASETAYDAHIWLDPENALVLAQAIKDELIRLNPADQKRYEANFQDLQQSLKDLNVTLEEKISAVEPEPYIVFHDAYHYFQDRFQLPEAHVMSLNPEIMPGVQRMKELRDIVVNEGAFCVFREPQFETTLVDTLVENTQAKALTLDPLGSAIAAGPDHYFAMMLDMADSFVSCFEKG
jgi:zinc transport system substrate-binding protein